MSVQSDKWIKKMVKTKGIIKPIYPNNKLSSTHRWCTIITNV